MLVFFSLRHIRVPIELVGTDSVVVVVVASSIRGSIGVCFGISEVLTTSSMLLSTPCQEVPGSPGPPTFPVSRLPQL